MKKFQFLRASFVNIFLLISLSKYTFSVTDSELITNVRTYGTTPTFVDDSYNRSQVTVKDTVTTIDDNVIPTPTESVLEVNMTQIESISTTADTINSTFDEQTTKSTNHQNEVTVTESSFTSSVLVIDTIVYTSNSNNVTEATEKTTDIEFNVTDTIVLEDKEKDVSSSTTTRVPRTSQQPEVTTIKPVFNSVIITEIVTLNNSEEVNSNGTTQENQNSEYQNLSSKIEITTIKPKLTITKLPSKQFNSQTIKKPAQYGDNCDLSGDLTCKGFELECQGKGMVDCSGAEANSKLELLFGFDDRPKINVTDYLDGNISAEALKAPPYHGRNISICKMSPFLKCEPKPSIKHCKGIAICKSVNLSSHLHFWEIAIIAAAFAFAGILLLIILITIYFSWTKLKIRPELQMNGYNGCTRV